MILTELPRQQGSSIGCESCAPCWKIDEMKVEKGLEMMILTMGNGLVTISIHPEW